MSDDDSFSAQQLPYFPKRLKIDCATFRELGHLYAKDATAVYSTRGVLKGVPADGFELVGECVEPTPGGRRMWCAYAAGPDAAFFATTYDAPRKIASKAPARLRDLGLGYATDGARVFARGVHVAGADPATFVPLSGTYGRDAQACWFGPRRIDTADPGTFRPLCTDDPAWALGADDAAVFHREYVVPDATPATVRIERGDNRWIESVHAGGRRWSLTDLTALVPTREYREVTFAPGASGLRFHDAALAGLERFVAVFCLLCSERSIDGLRRFSCGRVGEKAALRSIAALNAALPARVGEVTRKRIHITADGLALHRQYADVTDTVSALVRAFDGV